MNDHVGIKKSLYLKDLFVFLVVFICTVTGCRNESLISFVSDEIVYYGTTSRIRGFDPVKAGDVASALAISKVYEGLYQYAYLARPYKVIPWLAESLPEVSSDGLVYTFRIRKGIFFQDDPCFKATGGKGRELTAEDFVYSIKRVADAKNESTGYWAFNNRIVGLDEFRERSIHGKVDYDEPVEGLKVLDKYTLRITLKEPYPQLLWILTMHYSFAVPREAVEYYKENFIEHPVGTGPYILKSWKRNYSIEFVRNPKWKETGRVELYPSEGEDSDIVSGLLEDAGKPVPFIDRIVQYVIDDDSTEWFMFLTGELESSGISRDNWDAVITQERELSPHLKELGIRMNNSTTLTIFYIGFNMDDPVVGSSSDPQENMKRLRLRQAIACTFDSGKWIKFWNRRVIRAKGPIPPGVAGYEEKPFPYEFDLRKAKQFLEEAGYPDGIDIQTGKRLKLTLDLGSANDPNVRQAVELFCDFVSKIGVKIVPVYNNWPTFLGKLERRQVQMYWLGWVADYPDAENFLQLFYGPNSSPGPNHSNYSNPQFNELYEKVRVMQDSPERTELYRKMADIVINDCVWIFLHHPMSYGLHHCWLKNYKPHDFPYGMSIYYKIDSPLRERWKEERKRKRIWRL